MIRKSSNNNIAVHTILLVEDEAEVANIEARALKRHGFDVTVVYNDSEALETITKNKIDLVLMDI